MRFRDPITITRSGEVSIWYALIVFRYERELVDMSAGHGELSLRRLTYFVAVAEELHFGRAADRLNMAQPPLSQQIRVLEKDLGVTLFERSTRRVSLTSAGRHLYDDAFDVVARAQALHRSAQTLRKGEGGVLRIGFVDSASYDVLPRLIREHRNRWPNVRYELRSLSSDQQATELERRTIDLGIARTQPAGDLAATAIMNEPLLLAVNDDDPRSRQKTTSLTTLRGDRLIGFDRTVSPTLHAELGALFASIGAAYEPTLEATEYTAILGLVAAGEGVAVVPASVRSFRPPSLSYVGLREPIARTALVLLRRSDDRSPLVERVIKVVDELASARC